MNNDSLRWTLVLAGVSGIGFVVLITVFIWNVIRPSRREVPPVLPTTTPTVRSTPRPSVTKTLTSVPSRRPSIRLSPSPEPTYPITAVPDQTGGEDYILPPDQASIIEQKYKLRTSLPIKTGTFEITYDYRTYIYTVTFAEIDITTGKQQFAAWLKQNGYTALTLDMFTFR